MTLVKLKLGSSNEISRSFSHMYVVINNLDLGGGGGGGLQIQTLVEFRQNNINIYLI